MVNTKKSAEFLNIQINPLSKADVLEKIDKFLQHSYTFQHIVSLNPENVTCAQEDTEFRDILSQSDIQIVDGVGIALGGSILGVRVGERLTGVDLMDMIIKNHSQEGLHILLLGGSPNVAEELAKCYQTKYPNSFFVGIEGIRDIRRPEKYEEDQLFSIVADYKPQIIFAAFGSPWQEKWFWRHRDKLEKILCMGVGGGFDFAMGTVSRAPTFIRQVGLEWLYRLIRQPWRVKRQLKLFRYIYLVLKQKILG